VLISVRILIFFAILIYLPLTSSSAQSADAIIKHYLDTISGGDYNNWRNVKTAYIESTSFFIVEKADLSKAIPKPSIHKIYREWPDKSSSELLRDSVVLTRELHVKNDHYLIVGNQKPQKQQIISDDPYFEFEHTILKKNVDRCTSMTIIGTKTIDDNTYLRIEVVTKSLIWNYYFNSQNHLLEYWSNRPVGGEDRGILTKISDYKNIDGFLVPMSEIKTNANGRIFFSSNIRRIRFNVPIPPEKFMPGKK
jgi:hypothetical protein